MDQKQGNTMHMYESVSEVVADHHVRIVTVAAFPPAVEALNSSIQQIWQQDQLIMQSAKGKTIAKDSIADSLRSLIYTVSSTLASLAYRSSDVELSAQVKLTRSEVRHFNRTELQASALVLHNIAVTRQAALIEFGMPQETLDRLHGVTTAFNEAVGRQEGGFAARTAAREAMKTLFRRTTQLLKNDLDRLMELFRESDPDFYNAYWAARGIKNYGHRFRPTPETPVAPQGPVA